MRLSPQRLLIANNLRTSKIYWGSIMASIQKGNPRDHALNQNLFTNSRHYLLLTNVVVVNIPRIDKKFSRSVWNNFTQEYWVGQTTTVKKDTRALEVMGTRPLIYDDFRAILEFWVQKVTQRCQGHSREG